MIDWAQITGFDRDKGNVRKSDDKHEVSQAEAEQIFFNEPILATDHGRSRQEPRYHALGTTDDNRLLHVSFTRRGKGTLIRIISARDMHRKEKAAYEQAKEDSARI